MAEPPRRQSKEEPNRSSNLEGSLPPKTEPEKRAIYLKQRFGPSLDECEQAGEGMEIPKVDHFCSATFTNTVNEIRRKRDSLMSKFRDRNLLVSVTKLCLEIQ
jgi:hypothetical protein